MQPLFFLTIFIAQLASSQQIFINKVPAYSSLPSCAVVPLSTIVRDMEKGCGDGGKTTSFSCFCTKSSSAFDAKISEAVDRNCSSVTATGAPDQALSVFASYCELGKGSNGTVSVSASTTGRVANATISSATLAASSSSSGSLSSLTSAPFPASTSTAPSPSNTSGAGKVGRNMVLGVACAVVAGVMGSGNLLA